MAMKGTKRVAMGPRTVRMRAKDVAESNTKRERNRIDQNANHREDFDRLLKGMARSSEEPG